MAAFLDGRMDARRREEMLIHLAENDEDREVAVGAAAILRQLEEEDAAAAAVAEVRRNRDAPVIPLESRRPAPAREAPRRRSILVPLMALAAVLAAIALVTGRALTGRGSVADEPVRLAARLEHGAEGLPAGWTERRPWASARGEDTGGAASPAERAASSARAGAMLVDLSVAVQARDEAATRVLASQLAGRYDSRGGSGPLRRIVAGAGGDPERLRPLIGEATERIAGRLDEEALRLGAWTEAAGLAAARRDAGFFRDREALGRTEWLATADPPAHAAVQRVRSLLSAEPPRWDALAPAIDALARELASE
jgi:hypothetical protein